MWSQSSIIRRTTSNKCQIWAKCYWLNSFELWFELDISLLSNFVAVKRFILCWWLNHDSSFILFWNYLKSALRLEFCFNFRNFRCIHLPNLSVSCHEKAVCLFMEGNWLRSNKELFVIHANKNRRTICGCPQLMWVIFIHNNDTPLWFIRILFHDILSLSNCFVSCRSFTFELSNKLGCNLCVGIAVEFNSLKVFAFYHRVTSNYTIVDNVDFSTVIKMRMSILLNFLSTCSPSSVPNSNVRSGYIFGNLLNQSFNTVDLFVRLLSVFDEFNLDISLVSSKGDNSSTVIASVFKKLYTKG